MKDLSYLNKNASLSYEQFFLIVWFITEVGVNTLVWEEQLVQAAFPEMNQLNLRGQC